MATVPRGRPRNATPSTKVEPSLDASTVASLDLLIRKGYGKNRADVARYLILREIDDLKRAKVIDQTNADILAPDESA